MPLRASSTALAVRSSSPSTVSDIVAVTLSSRAPAVSLVASIRAMFAASRSAAPLVSASASLPRSDRATICASSAAARSLAVRPVDSILAASESVSACALGNVASRTLSLSSAVRAAASRPAACSCALAICSAIPLAAAIIDVIWSPSARRLASIVLVIAAITACRCPASTRIDSAVALKRRASAALDRRTISHATPSRINGMVIRPSVEVMLIANG